MAHGTDSGLDRVGFVLGGKSALGHVPTNNLELVTSIREGIAYASYEALAKQCYLTTEEAVASLLIPRRTLARRKSAGRLDVASGERVVRLARIAGRALEVFANDRDTANQWLRAPLVALNGATPLSLVDTDIGAQEVLDVLGRLEAGVFG
jgi:putative toxin-antitoxin system antitoxin component (TIGR02293 family)